MGIYRLDGIPVGDRDSSTGSKLQLGKLDPRLLAILINSGSTVSLHSLDYSKTGALLYPSKEDMNAARDHAARKLTAEFYLDNDLEETDPTLVYDDDESVITVNKWDSGTANCAITEETSVVAKGTSSAKINVTQTGTYNSFEILRSYGSAQDWSAKDFICFYWYGSNTGKTLTPILRSSSLYRYWTIVDNFTGWKRFVLPLRGHYTGGNMANLNLNAVTSFGVQIASVGGSICTFYLDRVVVDVGQWVKTEVHIPDNLALKRGASAKNALIRLWTWDGTQYLCGTESGPNDPDARYIQEADGATGYTPRLLNTYLFGTCYGSTSRYEQRASSITKQGRRRASPGTVWNSGAGASQGLTYSSRPGMLNRWGFSLKMPPDDGQDSSVGGISQIRFKLEANYV